MNTERRKQLDTVRAKLDEARIIIEQARDLLEQVRDDEQEAFDNLPESLQAGEKGERMNDGIEAMSDLHDSLDTMAMELGDTDDALTTAKGK